MNIQPTLASSGTVRGHSELRPINLSDEACFRAAIEVEQPQSWLYYFPFIYCFAQRKELTLLWEMVDSSICLYMLKTSKSVKQLSLFVPPFPFGPVALDTARRRIAKYNGNDNCRIVWAEERYEEMLQAGGFELRLREEEFIYDTQRVISAEGKEFGRLRQHLNRTRRLPEFAINPFRAVDSQACHELLDRWYDQLTEDKGVEVYGYHYVRSCLQNALSFDEGSVIGEVTWVNGGVAGFTFGGPIHPLMGSIFVSISDHLIDGLGYVQRHHMMSRFPELPFFNDSSDTGRKSLAHVKRQFRPAKMNRLSQALD
jgi:hypothetical protein